MKTDIPSILQNKRYIGTYTYKGTETPNVLPRIIEDDLFEKVQQKLRENKVAPARAKAKVDYLLSTKLFCGKCGANMIGNSGRSKTGENHYYYRCNGVKEKICDKKSIQKELIESIVLSEIHKLLTKKNIKKISKSIADFYKKGKDNSIEKSLEKRINENERKASKLALSLADCEIKSVQDTIFVEIEKLNKENDMLHKQLCDEKEKNKEISKEDVETFLFLLKEGKTDSIDSQRSLITIFVNKVILDDDKVTIIFNMGDSPTTVNKDLLDYIGKKSEFGFDALSSTIKETSFVYQGKRRFFLLFWVFYSKNRI